MCHRFGDFFRGVSQRKEVRTCKIVKYIKVLMLIQMIKTFLKYSQVRAVSSQLTVFEAEVGRLTETQTSAEDEWRSKTSHLQSGLNQTTAQKVGYSFTMRIAQEKLFISNYSHCIQPFVWFNTVSLLGCGR